jgi:hypothetical protein
MRNNIKLLLVNSFIIGFSLASLSKELPKYPISSISPELTINANAVVRNDETHIQLLSPSKFILKKTYAISILKESAVANSMINLMYGKFNRVNDVEANVYEANGNHFKKVRNDEILDISAIPGGTVYTDYRRKYIDPGFRTLPFTIEFEIVETYNSAFFLPSWSVCSGYNISTEKASLSIEYPEDYDLRFKENNLSSTSKVSTSEGIKKISWEETNFKAREMEPFSPSEEEIFPTVLIAPSKFVMDDYIGNMQSWKDFGKFISELNKETGNLPETTATEVKNLVANCKDDYEKIKLLYEYAQKKNRYISIQVGIGGWQSFDAETVDRLSYGDCKALSVYTKSLMNAAGLKAILVTIGAGKHAPYIDQKFPINNFNHMILCVPLQKDTVWLECTNSFIPAGYLGSFTDDRFALLIEDENSRLVKTPSFSAEENMISTKGNIILNENGDAKANFSQTYQGANYGEQIRLKMLDEKDRRDAIIKAIEFSNFDLNNYSLRDIKIEKPKLILNSEMNLRNFTTLMGSRMIVKMNQLNSTFTLPRSNKNREFNLEILRNQSEVDTVYYKIPNGFKLEALPPTFEINNEFGKIKNTLRIDEDQVQMIRYVEIYKCNKGPERFNEFREFLEKINTLNNSKFVLVKN